MEVMSHNNIVTEVTDIDKNTIMSTQGNFENKSVEVNTNKKNVYNSSWKET